MAHVFYPSGSNTYIRTVSGSTLQEFHVSTSDSGFILYLTGSGYDTASLTASYAVSASYAVNNTSAQALSTGSTYPITASWANTASNLTTPAVFPSDYNAYNKLSVINYNGGTSTGAELYFSTPSVSGSIGAYASTFQDQGNPNLIVDSTQGLYLSSVGSTFVMISGSTITETTLTAFQPSNTAYIDLGTTSKKWKNVYAGCVFSTSSWATSSLTASQATSIPVTSISPTGSSAQMGTIIYDAEANFLYVYTGAAWKSASFS